VEATYGVVRRRSPERTFIVPFESSPFGDR